MILLFYTTNHLAIGRVKTVFHRSIPDGFVVKVGTVKLEADLTYVKLPHLGKEARSLREAHESRVVHLL